MADALRIASEGAGHARRPRARSAVRPVMLAGVVLLGLPSAASPPPEPGEILASDLRALYAGRMSPGQRWRRDTLVRTRAGRTVPRGRAYRDDPDFVAATRWLLTSPTGDDPSLGAWLLGTAPPSPRTEEALVLALSHSDRGAEFEAALALAKHGSGRAVAGLRTAARRAPVAEVRAAAAWAAGEIERRQRPEKPGGETRPELPGDGAPPLAPAFRRGVSWWMSEAGGDEGRASFRGLARMGVTWVSIHTWDPLQRGLGEPLLAAPRRRFRGPRLEALVRSAHEAGLRVLVKPHLEMGWGADAGSHNRIEMHDDASWRLWFSQYEGYLLPYARTAAVSGADMFCVGRELDTTVIRREADWRRLIGQVRRVFPGPLVYSANFDTWESVGFWDALDFIGVSAYFPLSGMPDPTPAALAAGWERALRPLGQAARRFERPVLLTEAGFPAASSAARAPWRESRGRADVWLQSRCYEATLRALAAHPFVEGAFFWLWERPAEPPFRDPSHSIVDKPASFTMARWYSAR